MTGRKRTLLIILVVALLVGLGTWYRLAYYTAFPSSNGRLVLSFNGSDNIGTNGSSAEIQVGARAYFQGKITRIRLGTPKHTPATFLLTKPDGATKEIAGNLITRGLESDLWFYVPENGLSVGGELLDQPGAYKLTGQADGYEIVPLEFTVTAGTIATTTSSLFVTQDIGSYSLVGSELGSNFEQGGAQVQEYQAGYTLPDYPKSARLFNAPSRVSIQVTDPESAAKTLLLNELEYKKGSAYQVKSYVISSESSGPVHEWYSGKYYVKLSLTYIPYGDTTNVEGNNQILLDAFLKRFPPGTF